jgi:hypothetical protein
MKRRKRKLAGKTLFTSLIINSVMFVTKVKFMLYCTNFRLKTTLSARLISISTNIFVLNKVFVPAQLPGLVTSHGQISVQLTGRPI